MRKVELKKLEKAGFLSSSYNRYRSLYAYYLKERKRGEPKLQAIHNTGEKKGATQATVYRAISKCRQLI